jgi:hypothetical protein
MLLNILITALSDSCRRFIRDIYIILETLLCISEAAMAGMEGFIGGRGDRSPPNPQYIEGEINRLA